MPRMPRAECRTLPLTTWLEVLKASVQIAAALGRLSVIQPGSSTQAPSGERWKQLNKTLPQMYELGHLRVHF